MSSPSRRYLLVTPARNEAEFARRTLDSVASQSILPAKWIVVDDGSTDETPAILAEFAAKHPWIEVVTRRDRGVRSVGPGVIEAFYAGIEGLDLGGFDYLCKLDLDLDLPPRYFETLMERMEADPRLGTCSGKAWYPDPGDGHLVMEAIGDEMSVGASKFFRTECFRQIGGFARQVMWDGIDCHRCRMLGWKVRSFRDEDLKFLHLRPMGSSHRGILHGRARHGRGQYLMGSSPVFMLASCAYRLFKPPLVVGALASLWGYLSACVTRPHRTVDAAFQRFVRRYQWMALRRGKMRAAESIEAEMAAAWHGSGDGAVLPRSAGRAEASSAAVGTA
jgi:biofilm PGA synthesis N-glycosyltransferase PgaC